MGKNSIHSAPRTMANYIELPRKLELRSHFRICNLFASADHLNLQNLQLLHNRRLPEKTKQVKNRHHCAAQAARRPMFEFLHESILDLSSPSMCKKSCLNDHEGSFSARMEFRQTSSVPPSCKRTCKLIIQKG